MKAKLFTLIVFLYSFGIYTVSAQDNDLQKFVGIWTPSKTESNVWLGNMKITLENGKLLVQIKKHGEIQKCDDAVVNGNIIEFSCKTVRHLYTYHGRHPAVGEEYYSLGHPNLGGEIFHTYWEGTHSVQEKIGRPTYVNRDLCANKVISSCIFRGEMIDGNIQLSVKFNDAYYLDNIHGFSQASDWSFYSTYTNW